MATNDGQQSAGDKVVAQINDITNVIGTLVPTVGAIGSMVRLIAKAVKPSDAQKAQPFADAIAAFDAQVAKLNESIGAFEQAKQQAAALKASHAETSAGVSQPSAPSAPSPAGPGNAVGAMTTENTPLAQGKTPSEG